MKIIGTIVKRRSMGKSLAFVELQRTDCISIDDESTRILQVAFRRASSSWNKDHDDTFPTKASSLPYGARVEMDIISAVERPNEKRSGPPWEVRSWTMLANPCNLARDVAMQKKEGSNSSGGGVLCSVYLRARREAFTEAQKQLTTTSKKSTKEQQKPVAREMLDTDVQSILPLFAIGSCPQIDHHVNGAHGSTDKRAKALRAKVFARWILDTFGQDYLKTGGGVLDIAGGKGQLSIELSVTAQIPCTVIDPLIRKNLLTSRDKKRLRKVQGPEPHFIATPFDGRQFLHSPNGGENENLMKFATCLVGLHPDECTEDILDVALRYGKPAAVIPCCVFPTLFPHRRLKTGCSVQSYESFLQYLLEKDARLQRERLPFEGRNEVIYYKVT